MDLTTLSNSEYGSSRRHKGGSYNDEITTSNVLVSNDMISKLDAIMKKTASLFGGQQTAGVKKRKPHVVIEQQRRYTPRSNNYIVSDNNSIFTEHN